MMFIGEIFGALAVFLALDVLLALWVVTRMDAIQRREDAANWRRNE